MNKKELAKLVLEEEIQFNIWADLLNYIGKTQGVKAVRTLITKALTEEGQKFVGGYINDHTNEFDCQDDEYYE